MDKILRALSHPARVRLLRFVSRRESNVGELARKFGLRQPTTSQHLAVLQRARLVVARSNANRRLYRANLRELGRLRAFIDQLWDEGLLGMKRAAQKRKKVRR
jgi:DNA-binding transcriptional ArsR family regulator